jgi:hypothetical protein
MGGIGGFFPLPFGGAFDFAMITSFLQVDTSPDLVGNPTPDGVMATGTSSPHQEEPVEAVHDRLRVTVVGTLPVTETGGTVTVAVAAGMAVPSG